VDLGQLAKNRLDLFGEVVTSNDPIQWIKEALTKANSVANSGTEVSTHTETLTGNIAPGESSTNGAGASAFLGPSSQTNLNSRGNPVNSSSSGRAAEAIPLQRGIEPLSSNSPDFMKALNVLLKDTKPGEIPPFFIDARVEDSGIIEQPNTFIPPVEPQGAEGGNNRIRARTNYSRRPRASLKGILSDADLESNPYELKMETPPELQNQTKVADATENTEKTLAQRRGIINRTYTLAPGSIFETGSSSQIERAAPNNPLEMYKTPKGKPLFSHTVLNQSFSLDNLQAVAHPTEDEHEIPGATRVLSAGEFTSFKGYKVLF
jgi:hypothetical protein